MRCWIKQNPINPKRLEHESPLKAILETPPSIEADFTLHPKANPTSRKEGLVRYQTNPQADWGPKPRAHKKGEEGTLEARRKRGMEKAQLKKEAKREAKRSKEEKQTQDETNNAKDKK